MQTILYLFETILTEICSLNVFLELERLILDLKTQRNNIQPFFRSRRK